jgi:signal transduction histidine kinase/ActR/RegA family two-component response regulator
LSQANPVTAGDEETRPDAPGAGDRLRARQVEVLYDQLPVALTASIAAALILVGILWSATPAPVLLTWLGLLLVVTAIRSILVHSYRQSGDRQHQAGYWLTGFIAGTLVSGIVWDAAIIFLVPRGSTFHTWIAVLWVCGLTAGSIASLSSVRGVFFSFSVPALVPGAVYLLLAGDGIEATISGAMFLFLGFLSMNALRMHSTVKRSLQLQFENSDLIAHLDNEKERIEKLNAQLEKRVAERTAEISAANAAKSRFLAAASHDLRQPLQTISLLTAVLSKANHEPAHARAVHELRDTINVMGSLLDTLLDISRFDNGAVKPEVTEFPIGELLDRLRFDFTNHARDKNLGLRVVSSSAVIRSNPVLLEYIVRNLLSNAIRYTSSGKVLLGCRRHGSNLRIEVRDTGIGIPQEQVSNIFEEFYQLDNPARDRRKGWGLGLAIVARSARLLGHRIDVHSVPGKGSLFAVEVPLGTATDSPEQAPGGRAVVGNEHKEASIFLVEDEQAVREAMREMLELYDFRVSATANSEEASGESRALEVAPDLIIADYRLPLNRTGIDVVRNIRTITGAEIPGIILTGDISPKILQEARENRLAVIHKPVDPDELLALIDKQLAQAGSSTV